MEYTLTSVEARVLGALIEKSLTTPEYYPMSLNGLTAACNQKSSRDPVMSLSEQTVLAAIKSLAGKYLVWEQNTSGSRVTKYAHKLSGTLSKAIEFSAMELALVGLLLLRGPQTPGELRTRSGRMFEFQSLDDVEQTLRALKERQDGPYVIELAREPGKREVRFAQLFTQMPAHEESTVGDSASPNSSPNLSETIPRREAIEQGSRLEARVITLEREIDELKQQVAGIFNMLQHIRR